MVLRACYVLSGTDLAMLLPEERVMSVVHLYGNVVEVTRFDIALRASFAVSGTDLGYRPTRSLRDARY
eukprot:18354-Rhodomonas_salina.1